MHLNLGSKLAAAFMLMGALLLLSGGVGWYTASTLNKGLAFVTGPAWDAADGAMEGTIGVEAEMLTVEQAVSGHIDAATARKRVNEEAVFADEAFARLRRAGLVDEASLQAFDDELGAYRRERTTLLDAVAAHRRADDAMRADFVRFQSVMTLAEEHADAQVESLEANPDAYVTWRGQIAERWAAADGTMESQIFLLERLYLYQEMASGGDVDAIRHRLDDALSRLQERLGAVVELDAMRVPVPGDDAPGQTYAEALEEALPRHRERFAAAIDSLLTMHSALATYHGISDRVLDALGAVEDQGDATVENYTSSVSGLRDTAYTIIASTTGLGLLLAAGAWMLFMRLMVAPVRRVAEQMQALGSGAGGLHVKLDVRGNDEVAQLATGFNSFTDRLSELIGEVSAATRSLARDAAELAGVAESTRAVTDAQQQQTDTAAHTFSNMSAATEEISNSAHAANDRSTQAESDIANGREVLTRTIGAIDQMAGEVQTATSVIGELEDESNKIGSVVEVIRGIAEQTNLLALNAAIEAARAGEQGRGFAVVADEVRTLAGRTQGSTGEIQAMVERLQSGARRAVEVIERSRTLMQDNQRGAAEAGSALDGISDAVRSIQDVNAQIAAATEEQRQTARELSDVIRSVAEGSARSAQGAASSSAASERLAGVAHDLQALTARFDNGHGHG